MSALKIIAGLALVALWTIAGWVIAHHVGISRELVKDEAMPRPGPRANFLVLICTVVTGLSGVLIYLLVS